MKSFFIILALFSLCLGEVASFTGGAKNSMVFWQDSMRLDSTETKYTKVFPNDVYANKSILIEARDDSSAGFSGDSMSVKITVEQVWPFIRGNKQYFVTLPSNAHPDSSYPGSSEFILYDSLDILDMDTSSVYLRNRVAVVNPSGNSSYPGDSLKTLQTSGFGAFSYSSVAFDYSPYAVLKVTGLTRNKIKGVGSILKFSLYGLVGSPVIGR